MISSGRNLWIMVSILLALVFLENSVTGMKIYMF